MFRRTLGVFILLLATEEALKALLDLLQRVWSLMVSGPCRFNLNTQRQIKNKGAKDILTNTGHLDHGNYMKRF